MKKLELTFFTILFVSTAIYSCNGSESEFVNARTKTAAVNNDSPIIVEEKTVASSSDATPEETGTPDNTEEEEAPAKSIILADLQLKDPGDMPLYDTVDLTFYLDSEIIQSLQLYAHNNSSSNQHLHHFSLAAFDEVTIKWTHSLAAEAGGCTVRSASDGLDSYTVNCPKSGALKISVDVTLKDGQTRNIEFEKNIETLAEETMLEFRIPDGTGPGVS